MTQIVKKSILFILFAVFFQAVVFAQDKAAETPQPSSNEVDRNAIQQNLEKRGLPTTPIAPPAPPVDPAWRAYDNAPQTIPVSFGGTTPDGGNKWICPRGYRVNGTTRIPFSESNLTCQKDPFLFDLNQAGSCVHNPNSGNRMTGCITSIGPAPSSVSMTQPPPPPPAPVGPTPAQIYANAPETVPATSGGNIANGGRLWNCPKGYSVMNAAAIPFIESNLRCKKDPFLFNMNQCGNCVYTPNPTNRNAGCVRGVSMTCS